MKGILWGATLILNHVRAACAGIVWFVLFLFLPSDPEAPSPIIFLALPFMYLLGILPMALISYGLSKMGVPFIGLISVMLSILLIPGDPLTYIIHKYKPKLVPIDQYNIINFTAVILVKNGHYLTSA